MSKRTAISLLQNAAILLLTISACFLLLRVISYETGLPITLSTLFPSALSSQQDSAHATDLSDMPAPYCLVVTGAYGRSSSLPGDSSRPTIESLRSLLQEALGSAERMTTATETDFRTSLSSPGFYLDYLTPLSADIVAGRLGVSFSQPSDIRHILLADEGEDTVALYLWDGSNSVARYQTAASSVALQEAIAAYTADDTFFAFEGGENYAHLNPCTLLRRSTASPQVITAAVPALASDSDQLLSLLDFNVHTESRYQLSDGTEVIVESPRSLRLRPGGTVEYAADENTDSPLFHVSSANGIPTTADAVLAARSLIEMLFADPAFSSTALYLSRAEQTADGYTLSFQYMVDGLPVYRSDGSSAMTITISGSTITAFTLCWRQYTPGEGSRSLLPARQAAALASDYDAPYMTIGYADNGGSTLLPGWLAL